MSDRGEQLPDTDDPFELLAVDRDIDARGLKRAYVRRLKVFRPDDNAEAFRRIRAAYEEARALVSRGPPSRSDRAPPKPSPRPSVVSHEVEAASPAAAAPEIDEEETVPASVPGRPPEQEVLRAEVRPPASVPGRPPEQEILRAETGPPGSVPARAPEQEVLRAETGPPSSVPARAPEREVLRAESGPPGSVPARAPERERVLEEEADAPDVPPTAEGWRAALEAGIDLSDFADDFEDSWGTPLAAAGLLRWSKLRHLSDAHLAAHLFGVGVEVRGKSADTTELLDEISSEAFQRALVHTPELEPAIWRALAFAAWDQEARTQVLLEIYPPRADDDTWELDVLEFSLYLAEGWGAVRDKVRPTPTFERLLPLLATPDLADEEMCEEVVRDISAHPDHWLETLDATERDAAMISRQIQVAVDAWEPPDGRLWDELSPAEQKWLSEAVEGLDKALKRNAVNAMITWGGIICLLGSLVSVVVLGWWGFLPLLVTIAFFVVLVIMADKYLYRRVVRPFLRTRFVNRGISPDRVTEAIAMNTRWDDDMGRFATEISEDTTLTALAAIRRIGLKRNIGAGGSSGSGANPGTDGYADEHVAAIDADPAVSPYPEPAALTRRCSTHPEREASTLCSSCRREICEACTEVDPMVGTYCVDCDSARLAAVREHCLSAERSIRRLGASTVTFASLLSILAAGMLVNAEPQGWGVLLGVVVTLTAGIATLRRVAWARYLQGLVCGLSLFVFPVGTLWGGSGLWNLRGPRAARIFSPEYTEVIRSTPSLKVSWVVYVLLVLAALLFLLALARAIDLE